MAVGANSPIWKGDGVMYDKKHSNGALDTFET